LVLTLELILYILVLIKRNLLTIKITPIASETLGVRSMATFVETHDVKLLMDAGASLGPRFGLLPHPIEYKALKDARNSIERFASKADIITISHYHFDHYTAAWSSIEAKWTWSSYNASKKIYGGKVVLAKDYQDSINASQRRRGWIFSKIANEFVKEIRYADSSTIKFGETIINFSQPLPHGEDNTSLGFVLSLYIKHGDEDLLYCPDFQGPMSDKALSYILNINPTRLIIGGPPIYLSEYKVLAQSIEKGFKNLTKIVSKVPLTIVDHHMMRDKKALGRLKDLKEKASENGNTLMTFAEYLGKQNTLLEAMRPQLYDEFPPDRDFQNWAKLSPIRQRSVLPPL
jgi:predicted metallo-beta-lactamase superfamily hydrolase